jgi:hypothetical protein
VISLDNAELHVELLDPRADRQRFGTRYCTGGYIFQITDARRGPLLSGPTYPDTFNWFDGQGIPDAFNLSPLHSTQTPGDALIAGIGVCHPEQRVVHSFCDWTIEHGDQEVAFAAEQRYEDFALTLTRTVSLEGRMVRSYTHLTNIGGKPIPLRWFPHPFFPQPESDELLWINAPLRWRAATGYKQLGNGFIARSGWPWRDGHYLPLDHDATAPLVLLQRHPVLGIVAASCSYVPDFFPVWGNAITFSWEPFLERTVAPGQAHEWWIDYFF